MVTTNFSKTTQLKKLTHVNPEQARRAAKTFDIRTSLSRVLNIWLMTLSEKKVMASHCTKDGEKMEQRPSPVLAERKRTPELSPCSSLYAQQHAGKLPHCSTLQLAKYFGHTAIPADAWQGYTRSN